MPRICRDAHVPCQDMLQYLLYSGSAGPYLHDMIHQCIRNIGTDFPSPGVHMALSRYALPKESSLTMLRALRDYGELTGFHIGFKPAGGLKTAKDAMNWLILMKEELGRRWLEPDLFRIGASSMLGDIERQLEHHVTGRYAAASHQPLA